MRKFSVSNPLPMGRQTSTSSFHSGLSRALALTRFSMEGREIDKEREEGKKAWRELSAISCIGVLGRQSFVKEII